MSVRAVAMSGLTDSYGGLRAGLAATGGVVRCSGGRSRAERTVTEGSEEGLLVNAPPAKSLRNRQ